MDDAFAITEKTNNEKEINLINKKIKFTTEIKRGGTLNYPDVKITKTRNQEFENTVYSIKSYDVV